ncbi:MAG: RecX family transcriptional regulator [Bacteroidaceae bacterium]|jgi:regulatory protein|nr:RecX family transcriptional regulator [Bacteroidaceae bacterium]
MKKKTMTEEAALLRLSAQCAAGELCISDVKRKMSYWEMPEGAEERVIAQLLKEKFIDENRYAHAFVRDKFKYNKWGKTKIEFELKKKGISSENIADALTEIEENDSEEVLLNLLKNKLKSTKGKSDYEVFLKLLRFSAQRGFSQEQAHRCLQKIIKEDWE